MSEKMEKVLKTFHELGGPLLNIGYSSANFINTYVMTTPTFDWVKNLDWWIANWTTASEPLLPIVFSKFAKPKSWKFWQFSSTGNGPFYGASSPRLDLNRYYKDLATFNAEYRVNLEVRPFTPPPDSTPLGEMMVRTPGGINLHSGPGQKYPIIGGLSYKQIVTPIQVDGANAWVEIFPGKWACVTLDSGGQHLRFLEKVAK